MRKVLLLLLFPLLAFSQVQTPNCAISLAEVNDFIDNYGKLANSYIYYSKENESAGFKQLSFILAPNEMSKEAVDKLAEDFKPCDECSRITFSKFMKGADENLKIEGTPVYRLETIQGQFLRIFPYWQKYYMPTATTENYKEFDQRHLYLQKNRMSAKFESIGTNGKWEIRDYRCAYIK